MSKKVYIFIGLAVVIIIAAGIYVDKSATINTAAPQNSGEKVSLGDFGQAADFKIGDNWLNSAPLTISSLKGKVVLVDFWTYSCINCIRTLPHVTKWYDAYKDKGLVVVGVHTPEFAFEHDAGNVAAAIKQFGIHYPVVQDNDYSIWNSYHNQYWPAEYLIDQTGKIVEEHFGEGDYDKSENAIRQLLGLDAAAINMPADNLGAIASPEMYFGTDRLQNLVIGQTSSVDAKNYALNSNPSINSFSLGGTWQFSASDAQLIGESGQINLKFHSGKAFMVAASQNPATLHITVDGKKQPDVIVQQSKLYPLFDSQDYGDHLIQITITGAGFEAFTFTFG